DGGETGQGPDDVVRSGVSAEVGLETPDAHDDARVDTKSLVRLLKPGADRLGFGAAALDALRRNGACDVVPDRPGELGLLVGVGDDSPVEGDAEEGAVERLARNPTLLGERPQRRDEFPKRMIAGRLALRRGVRRKSQAA